MRNEFSHDYPMDNAFQAAVLNKAYVLAEDLLRVLQHIESFGKRWRV